MRPPYRRPRAAAALTRGASLLATLPLAGALSLAAGLVPTQASAACLGTHRTITVDPARGSFYNGLEKSLGLRQGEVVLTFDDGPKPGTTTRILNALSEECAKATFFMSGRMASAYPALAARVRREGHTVANHTHAHENLANTSSPAVISTIDRGARAIKAATGVGSLPFFRYPYLARSQRTDAIVRSKGLVAFGTNIDSKDYKKVSPGAVVAKTMRDLRRQGKGIVLMHDIHARTATALPMLLDKLKAEGFKVVHMVPGRGGRRAPDVLVASADAPGTAAREPRTTRERRPTHASAYASSRGRSAATLAVAASRAEARRRSGLARIVSLASRGSEDAKRPLTDAEKARAKRAIRRSTRLVASAPLHERGAYLLQLERRRR